MPPQPVVLVERLAPGQTSLLDELKDLAETVDYEVTGCLRQVRVQDSAFQIGRGKAEELGKTVRELAATKVIFENELKPIQAYNLAKLTGVEIIDKYQLVLDVFSRRASTREAKLQIQLARLRYELNRAKEKVRLAKRGEQPGFHGLGKYEADVYYAAIRRQISHIEEKLQKIRETKTLRRLTQIEIGLPIISLAGYTMAGKTTLFNALAEKNNPVGGGPFTTLTTKAAAVNFAGKKALLSDTVGFIERLPIPLVEAFKSTLEETVYSSLILLVIDCSERIENIRRKLACCLTTLREIGAALRPTLIVFNKIDLADSNRIEQAIAEAQGLSLEAVAISARKKANLEELKNVASSYLRNFVRASFEMPITSPSISMLSKIRMHSLILSEQYREKAMTVTVQTTDHLMDRIRGRVETIGGRMIEACRV